MLFTNHFFSVLKEILLNLDKKRKIWKCVFVTEFKINICQYIYTVNTPTNANNPVDFFFFFLWYRRRELTWPPYDICLFWSLLVLYYSVQQCASMTTSQIWTRYAKNNFVCPRFYLTPFTDSQKVFSRYASQAISGSSRLIVVITFTDVKPSRWWEKKNSNIYLY